MMNLSMATNTAVELNTLVSGAISFVCKSYINIITFSIIVYNIIVYKLSVLLGYSFII